MKAMVIDKIVSFRENSAPLSMVEMPVPEPKDDEILVKVSACGVCHTELDEIEGRTPPPRLPVVPGHQIVGRVVEKGSKVKKYEKGDRVGIGWIYSACHDCPYCKRGDDNLCEQFMATGRDADGGYAEFTVIHEDFAFKVPEIFTDLDAAPLLCAGAIGYRSLRLTRMEDGQSLGLTGFGASGHLVLKMSLKKFPASKVYVFARSEKERAFALELGAYWAGNTDERPPELLDAIIDTTPVWTPIVHALRNLKPGGRLIINAIRKEDIDKDYLMKLHYPSHLWLEKEIKSVANVATRDIAEFLDLAAQIPIKPEVQEFSLEQANKALRELKERKIRGAKVLKLS